MVREELVDTHLLEVPKVCGLSVIPEILLQMPLLKNQCRNAVK